MLGPFCRWESENDILSIFNRQLSGISYRFFYSSQISEVAYSFIKQPFIVDYLKMVQENRPL